MAVPKRKVSRSKRGSRNAHSAIKRPNSTPCPVCNYLRPSHRICPNCGSYGKLKVVKHEGV